MNVIVRTVVGVKAVPAEEAAMILYLTPLTNGVSLALDFREVIGSKVKTRRLLKRGPRSKKVAIQLAKDLAMITDTRHVYIINCHDNPDKRSTV